MLRIDSMQLICDILLGASESRKGIRWFCKRNDSLTTLGNVAKNAGALSHAAAASSRGWDCFIHLNPSKGVKGVRAKSSDVTNWSFVLIDIDPTGKDPLPTIDPLSETPHEEILARIILNQVQGKAEELLGTILDPAIIYTGRGYHLWLRLKPIPVSHGLQTGWPSKDINAYRGDKSIENATRNFLTELAKHAPEGVRIDVLPDLARIARLPNSINQKTGRYARLIQSGSQQDIGEIILNKFGRQTAREFVDAHPEWYKSRSDDYSNHSEQIRINREANKALDTFSGWTNDELFRPGYTVIITDPSHGLYDWRDVFWTLTKRARDYIGYGASEGSRHEAMFATCRSLFEKGVEKESASEALRIGNRRCHEPLGNMEINRQLTRIYK